MSEAAKVSIATSQEELEAIWRFRYEIYVDELKRNYPSADHGRRWLRDAEDEDKYAVNLYLGPLDRITGAERLLIWPAGKIPEDYHRLFSMEMFPGIESVAIAELGRLMVRPSARGKNVFPLLVDAMGEQWAEHNVQLCFLYCVPGLLKHYRRSLSARPYDGRLIPAGSSVGIPMVVVVSDPRSLCACAEMGTPAGNAEAIAAPGFDVARLSHILEGDSVPVKLDEEAVWEHLKRQLLEDEGATPAFLNALSLDATKRLTSSGFILHLSPGDMIAKSGTREREMYVILDGVFEVIAGEKRLAILDKGDVFGEIAFFSAAGERSASVRAATEGEVLVLRRSFLEELTRSDPEAGLQILTNIGSVMADRIVSLNQALLAATDPCR